MNLRRLLLSTCALAAAPFASCVEEGEGTFLYQVRNTRVSVASNTKVVIRERWLVFLGDELTTGASGTDVNADMDVADQFPVVVNMATRTETRVGVAADDIAILGSFLFLVVDELKDERDWNGDGDTAMPDDLVLLRVAAATPTVANLTFVANLSRVGSGPRMLVSTDGGELFFAEDDVADPLVAPETSINVVRISGGAPTVPARLSNDDAPNVLRPQLAAEDNGIVFCVLDETLEGRELNGDGLADDPFVLALINSADANPVVKSTERAMSSATAPVRAISVSASDYVVAFLVDETAQGAASLNNYALAPNGNWRPSHCAQNDTDTTDEVLHFIRYGAWFAGTESPVNTFFAGEDRVLAVRTSLRTYVATVVPESDDGNCVTNGLNNDADTTDRVLRWIATTDPLGSVGVFSNVNGLVALANTAGGTRGVTDLAGRFIAVVDEDADNRNYDGLAAENTLVAWLNPDSGNSATWTFDHGTQAGIQATGTRWMGEQPGRTRVGVGFMESVFGAPINGRDTDTTDSMPAFARFDPGNANDFDFPLTAIGIDEDNAGILITAGVALYRVDEAADNFDWNNDGDKLDFVLFRTNVSTGLDNFAVSTLNTFQGPAAFYGSGAVGVAFIADESMISTGSNRDLNGDGDPNDYVVRWMRVGP